VGWRNIHDVRVVVEFKPRAKWMVSSSTAITVWPRSVSGTAGTYVENWTARWCTRCEAGADRRRLRV